MNSQGEWESESEENGIADWEASASGSEFTEFTESHRGLNSQGEWERESEENGIADWEASASGSEFTEFAEFPEFVLLGFGFWEASASRRMPIERLPLAWGAVS